MYRCQQRRVSLDDDQEKIKNHDKERAVRVPHRLERQFSRGFTLEFPCAAKTEVRDADEGPGNEGGRTRNRHQVSEDLSSTSALIDQCDEAQRVGDDDSVDWHALARGFCEDLGCSPQLSQGQQSARGDIYRRVDGGKNGCEYESVNKVRRAFPTGVL